MGAISQDLSSAGMTVAIDASWSGVFEQWGRSPLVQLHDEARDLRWYVTPRVPLPHFNHAYYTRLRLYPGVGHLSIDNHIKKIVEDLLVP
jgi:hypothetical protein